MLTATCTICHQTIKTNIVSITPMDKCNNLGEAIVTHLKDAHARQLMEIAEYGKHLHGFLAWQKFEIHDDSVKEEYEEIREILLATIMADCPEEDEEIDEDSDDEEEEEIEDEEEGDVIDVKPVS